MKKASLLFCILLTLFTEAQMNAGKVIYERTLHIRRLANNEVAGMIPPTRKDNYELLFGNNQSLFQLIPAPDGDGGTVSLPGMNGSITSLRIISNNDVIYYNFTAGKRMDEKEMFDREFLVEDTVEKIAWKLGDETKNILNHTAQKATAQRIGNRWQMSMENGQMKREQVADTSVITAWFTTAIPVTAGPGDFQGLPGLILEVELNSGRVVYKAIEISPKISLSSIKEPKGGKKLTAAQFAIERERLMEEMQKNRPANGSRNIRIN